MLVIKDVCKTYGKQTVLNNTSMTVEEGIRVLLGINGCGKSTLLKIITGVADADSGSVQLKGEELLNLPPEKRRIGYVPQHTALFPNMTAYDNILYGLRSKEAKQAAKAHVDELIEMLELGDFLNKRPGQLSGGYKSRVSLARALAPDPNLMLLDEPLSDVDVVMKERLLPEFKKVIHTLGIPAIYVTHDPSEAQQVGDSFCSMVQGNISGHDNAAAAFDFIRQEEIKHLEANLLK
ncbi:MAG: ABC transporter ATP-binding protein [Clostridiales bacterium]|nr:ABC transporter ATP-binding protein [Clostridiales bacterium]